MRKADLIDAHKKAAEQVIHFLSSGKKVVFLTLGDPEFYSTFYYVATFILYGEKDHFQSLETMEAFAEVIGADLSVMPNGEHWFHTDEQTEFRKRWLIRFK